jgi:hypothetical protein
MVTGKVKSKYSQKNLLVTTLTNSDPTEIDSGLYPHIQWEAIAHPPLYGGR